MLSPTGIQLKLQIPVGSARSTSNFAGILELTSLTSH